MTKFKFFTAFFVLCIATTIVYAQNFKGKEKVKVTIAQPQNSLKVGETLTYSVEWLGIPSGKIILQLPEITSIDGHECYHIVARAMPNSFFAKFYDVEYEVHTYLDVALRYPHRFIKKRRIKNTFTTVTMDFDRKNNVAGTRYDGTNSGVFLEPRAGEEISIKAPKDSNQIYPATQDLLSSLFYFRLLAIAEGQSYPIYIYYGNKNWPLSLSAGQPFAKEIRKKGALDVFEASPSSDLAGFILGKRKLYILFTADSYRIPVEFGLNTNIGPIRGRLQDLPQ